MIRHISKSVTKAKWAVRTLALLVAYHCTCTTLAQTDSVRVFTTEHPLIYEDAWDLWPYVFLNENGEPDGYNIDLLKLIFKELDIPYVIKLMPTLEAQADLKSGKSDLMLRMDAEFSRGNSSYGKSIIQLFTHSVVMPKDHLVNIETGKDLSRYTVIVHDGAFSHHLLKNKGWAKEIIAYDDMKEAIQHVSSADEGIIVWNTMSLRWLMRKFHTDNLTIQPIDLPYGEYKFMSKNSRLLEQIDSVYASLRAADRLQPIQNKWFYPDRKDSGIPEWVWKLAAVLAIIALAVLLNYFYYRIRERKVNKALRKSNNRLSLVLKTSHVRLWIYNVMTKTFTWIDEQGKPQRNSTIEEFSYRYHPDDVRQLQQAIDDIIQQKVKSADLNIKVFEDNNGRDAHDYTVSLSVLRYDKGGKPDTILCTRSDVTNELLRQMKVKDTMLRYQAIFQTAMIDMVSYDEHGIIQDINQKALKALGTDIETIRKKKISINDVLGMDVSLDNIEYMYMTQIFDVNSDGRSLNKLLKRNKLYYELQIMPIHDINGKLIGIFGTGRDVTEIAETYQNLEKNMLKLQEANDEITEYIRNIDYVLTVGGIRIVKYDIDTHLLTIFSESNREEYTLTQTRLLNLVDARSKKKVERILNSMDNQISGTVQTDIKTAIHGRNKKILHLQFHFIPYYDKQGRVKEYFGMCRDISELKDIEEKLATETLRAQEVEVVKNAFLHNMSFEIRTPLNAVVGFAELFQMDHSQDDEIIFINEIKENSSKLLKLINDILFLSRLDADMVTMRTSPIDFAQTIEGKCEAIWANDKKPGVEYIVKKPFRKLVVDIDDTNISIIMDKIITNAVEYTTQGRILVRYDYLGDELIIAVEDTGEGIPEDILAHIFERFVTGDSNNSKAGLGLSICHDLIQHLGGTINIKSELGKGTSVWFTVPCKALEMDRI
jgi:PAS domain S-box-containing protein